MAGTKDRWRRRRGGDAGGGVAQRRGDDDDDQCELCRYVPNATVKIEQHGEIKDRNNRKM